MNGRPLTFRAARFGAPHSTGSLVSWYRSCHIMGVRLKLRKESAYGERG